MKDIMERLISLQLTDEKMIIFKKEKLQIPENLKGKEDAITTLEAEKEEIKEKMDRLSEELSLLEEQVDETKGLIRRAQTRMLVIKTQREHQAVQREGEVARKRRGDLEGRKAEILESKEAAEKNLLETDSAIEKERDAHKEEKKRSNERLKDIERELEELEKTRETEQSFIDSETMERYNKISQRYKGEAVVEVIRGVCKGCFMTLPPQLYNQVLAKGRILECPHCGRIIYVDEAS